MAKALPKNAGAQSTEIDKAPVTSLSNREDFIEKGDRTGADDIKPNEVRMPRLSIAQAMSPEVQDDSSKYVEGLKTPEMFNDLIGTIYGKGPLYFVAVRRDIRRIEFRPRAEGGGVIDFNVPPNDPRNEWTEGEDGKRVPPRATKFHEFVILILREDGTTEPIVLSIKDTNKHNRRAAERLTGFIASKGKPIYTGIYTIQSKTERNSGDQPYGVPVINNAGMLDDKDVPDDVWERNKALFFYAKQFAENIKGKVIDVNREPGDEEDFDTDAMDAKPVGSASTTGERPKM